MRNFLSWGLAMLCLLVTLPTAASSQLGTASYYADSLHGNPTANGEAYDRDGLTAAHRSLDFGISVNVTNLDNGKSVVVRINDRGPQVEDRIIDLSRAAAEALGMIDSGTAEVRLEIVD